MTGAQSFFYWGALAFLAASAWNMIEAGWYVPGGLGLAFAVFGLFALLT